MEPTAADASDGDSTESDRQVPPPPPPGPREEQPTTPSSTAWNEVLGGGADGPGGAEFAAFKKEHEGKVRFHASIADMPKPDGKMMAMVRTRRLLRAATASTRVASRND